MKNSGLITKTINTPTTSSASGVWSLQEQYEAETNEVWPKAVAQAVAPNASTDPYFSDVTLLTKFEGTNGGTTFTDSSSNNCTLTGNNAVTSTAETKFGTSSGYFGASNSAYVYVSSADSGVSDFGTGDFTVEMFVYRTIRSNGVVGDMYFDNRQGTNNGAHLIIYTPQTSANALEIDIAGTTYTTTNAVPTNQWSHIAVTRENGTVKGFIDGVLGVTGTNNTTSITDGTNNTRPLIIGGRGYAWGGSTDRNLDGYIDELRITKGVARYTSTFTPPTAEFPTSSTPSIFSTAKVHVDADDTNSYSGTGTTWSDLSGNNYDFTLSSTGLYNSTGVKHMSLQSDGEKLTTSSKIPISDTNGVTYVVATRILQSTAKWRTLTEENATSTHVIIENGTNELAMYDWSVFTTRATSYSILNNPQYATNGWVLLYFRWASGQGYKVSYNDTPSTIRGTLASNSSASYGSSGGIDFLGNGSYGTSAEAWGDIAFFAAWETELTDAELTSIYNAYRSRFSLP